MSETTKVPPAILARQLARSVREAGPRSEGSWKEMFWNHWGVGKILENVSTKEKKHLIIAAASITTAVSLGGFVSWYLYTRLMARRGLGVPDILEESTIQKLRAASAKKRISTGSKEHVRDGVLILHQCPRGRKCPCIAPYPLKLETFLRIHSIKYETDFDCLEPRTSDAPWITLDLEDICDSQNCMKFLIERYSLATDKEGQNEETKANVRAYTHLLENHLYWGIALWRWVYDGARSLQEIQLLPSKTLKMVPQVCKTIEQAAWFHGIGKKSPIDVTQEVIEDLAALSSFLGDRPYFVSEKPCELDCTAFAMLAQMVWNMDGSPYEKVIKDKHTNLVAFCWRMKQEFWADWEHCLNNEPYED